jgi:hypothetical protein
MFTHPTITAALADQHRRDLTARAEKYRTARAARATRPEPSRLRRIIPGLVAAARRPVMYLPLPKAPAAPRSS